ncbi:hypothetical protein KFK09_014583 [Dendrobium nobile]|uniref:Uncharacterized protein n=1 Tax=Dendrobium nobile TaxID=94219 RepID=A0A8T3B3H6_DENNO|nr:hypothetical protein KFK09_014583 [Dendrobium nobile]
MGSCVSHEATAVAPVMTAKLILPDGELREFAWPVKASHAIQKETDCFVCDADDMEFDGFVTAIPADEELRPGQIYFALPRSMLGQPMPAENLAALAVKASSALMKAAPGRKMALIFPEMCSPATTVKATARKRRNGGMGRCFETNLGSIPE